MGAIVTEGQMRRVLGYIDSGLREGAGLRAGGKQVHTESGGYYIEPTIFDCPHQAIRIVNEEIFGPVITILPYKSEEEVIRLANDTIYGLAAYVQGADLGAVAVHRLLVGGVAVGTIRRLGDLPDLVRSQRRLSRLGLQGG